MCAGLSNLQTHHVEWLMRKHGAFEIDREELGLSAKQVIM